MDTWEEEDDGGLGPGMKELWQWCMARAPDCGNDFIDGHLSSTKVYMF